MIMIILQIIAVTLEIVSAIIEIINNSKNKH